MLRPSATDFWTNEHHNCLNECLDAVDETSLVGVLLMQALLKAFPTEPRCCSWEISINCPWSIRARCWPASSPPAPSRS